MPEVEHNTRWSKSISQTMHHGHTQKMNSTHQIKPHQLTMKTKPMQSESMMEKKGELNERNIQKPMQVHRMFKKPANIAATTAAVIDSTRKPNTEKKHLFSSVHAQCAAYNMCHSIISI